MRAKLGLWSGTVNGLMMLSLWVRLGMLCCGLAILVPAAAWAEFKQLTGQVRYLSRIALPEDAVLEVTLLDVSLADAPAFELAAITVRPNGQVPIAFRLTYDEGLVDERYSYSVRATIKSGQTVLFQNTSHVPALTRGAGNDVEVIVEQAPVKNAEPVLAGTDWTVVKIDANTVPSPKSPTIAFSHKESLNGFSGCNNYTAPVVFSGDGLQLGPIAATKMACKAPMAELEHTFFTALERAARYQVMGAMLILKDKDGRAVLTFN